MRKLSPLFLSVFLTATGAAAQGAQGPNQTGDTIYLERCATCHDAGVSRAPNPHCATPADNSFCHNAATSCAGNMISKPSSPV